MKPQNITLYLKDAKSDKAYNVSLEKSKKLYIVNYAYGKRGGNLKEGTKTPKPVTYDKALAIYEKLIKSKTDKGYKESKPKKSTVKKTPKRSKKEVTGKSEKTAKPKASNSDRAEKVLLKELKGLIKSKKNPVDFLNTLTSSERDALRPSAIALLPKEEEKLKEASLYERQIWYTFLENPNDKTFEDYYFLDSLGTTEVFKDLLDHYQPDWLESNLNIGYLEKIDYFKKGVFKSTLRLNSRSPLWELEDMISAGRNRDQNPCAFLYQHEMSLNEHIWLIFSTVSNVEISRVPFWVDIFLRLMKDDKIPRAKVISHIQNFKTSDIRVKGIYGREKDVTNWVYKLLYAMKPTAKELMPMQDKLIENIGRPKVPFARNHSVELLKTIVPKKDFKVDDCIHSISINIESTKIILSELIIDLAAVIHEHYPSHALSLRKAMLNGNNNPKKSVQNSVSDFIAKHY